MNIGDDVAMCKKSVCVLSCMFLVLIGKVMSGLHW